MVLGKGQALPVLAKDVGRLFSGVVYRLEKASPLRGCVRGATEEDAGCAVYGVRNDVRAQ